MARAYLVFGDIESKLDVLQVECTKCSRKGRYHVHKLIEKYGRKGPHDEMEAVAQRRLSEAGRASIARAVRLNLPRSAEGDMIGTPLRCSAARGAWQDRARVRSTAQ